MKTKIANALKTKYANLGLGEKAFNGVATYLEKTVTNEADIESAIADDSVKFLLQSIQGETDTIRTAKAGIEKQLDELKKKYETKPVEKNGEESETAKMLKELLAKQEAMEAKIAAEAKKAHDSEIISKVHEIMKGKGATNDFVRKITLQGIEIAEGDTAESLAEKYQTAYDTNFKEAFGDGIAPIKGSPSNQDYKKGDFKGMAEMLTAQGLLPAES